MNLWIFGIEERTEIQAKGRENPFNEISRKISKSRERKGYPRIRGIYKPK